MIISITHNYEPYFNKVVAIEDVSSGRKKDVYLVLYRDIVSTGFNEVVAKKPIVKFFDGDELEIPLKRWTPEMKALARQEMARNPVKRYRRITTLGKVVISVAGVLVMVGIAALIYGIFVSAPQSRRDREAFAQLPEVGDRFFGSLFGQHYMEGGKLQSGWIITESVNPQDSVVRLRLADEVGEFSFDTKSMEHEHFNGPTYRTKFSTDGRKVMFKGVENDFSFESTVYNDNFGAYKIPVANEE